MYSLDQLKEAIKDKLTKKAIYPTKPVSSRVLAARHAGPKSDPRVMRSLHGMSSNKGADSKENG
mgnify:CR=1 FL=1|tara:strand:- start:185 stop:376 length:192 start_codon:yes stop_codon:yes gene_type:complete